jgi:hypothetical protein
MSLKYTLYNLRLGETIVFPIKKVRDSTDYIERARKITSRLVFSVIQEQIFRRTTQSTHSIESRPSFGTDLLLFSLQSATGPHSEPVKSSRRNHILFL